MPATAETQHPAWYRAATLNERIEAPHPYAATPVAPTLEPGRQRLQRWRQMTPFQEGPLFAERLSRCGLEEKNLLELLAEPDEALRDRLAKTPPWLSILDQAFRDHPDSWSDASSLPARDGADYLQLAAPLVQRARKHLRKTIRSLARCGDDLPFDPAIIEDLLTSALPRQMFWTLGRTVALELYIAKLEGKLSGQSSKERYRSFFDRLADPQELRRLYQTYPVLARLLTVHLENWCAASRELLERLVADWPKLQKVFSPEQHPGRLVELQSGLGDRHLGGRTVCCLHFDSGLRLIYKPQPMGVAVHFQELLAWLNERGCSPPQRILEILDRGSYGWVEFVEPRPCRSSDELCRFYQRQGSLLALLHALGGHDVHSENLIAWGEHPVLIDFETVIGAHWGARSGGGKHVEITAEILRQTVLHVGLLPVPQESDGMDHSGLGSLGGQRVDGLAFAGQGSDHLRLERRATKLKERNNRPILEGKAASVSDYHEEIHGGFSRTYRFLLKHRAELLATDGPLQRFATDQVRVVIRPTRVYGELLGASYHPYLLGDALDRHRHFDHLWLDAENMPRLKELIAAESEALEQGDIPYFSTSLNGRHLMAGPRHTYRDLLPSSGYQQLEKRFHNLSEGDLQRQLSLISNTLVAHQNNTATPPPRRAGYSACGSDQATVGRKRLLAAAADVGDRLETLAHRAQLASGQQLATWIQPSITASSKCVLNPMEAGLYGGLPGVVLFLAHLGKICDQERYTDLARAAMATLDLQLTENEHHLETVGAFKGWGGLIYAFTQLSRLWEDPRPLRRALSMLEGLPEFIREDKHHDIIAGVAGLIPALLSLHRCSSSARALELAAHCGERLEATARPQDQGVGWPLQRNGQALAGFSHGASGVAWALYELAAALGASQRKPLDSRFADLASAALRYERTLFDPSVGRWRDLRSEDPAARSRVTWCHGAPGIGLGRLGMLRHTDDAELRDEAEMAIRATLQEPLNVSHCLCHGDLGNLELLLQARQVLDMAVDQDIEQRSGLILRDIEQHGWIDGTVSGMETPGLMSGLAGIGYGLLRLAEPDRVPSVLLLADT